MMRFLKNLQKSTLALSLGGWGTPKSRLFWWKLQFLKLIQANGKSPLQKETENQEGRPREGTSTSRAQTSQPTSKSDQHQMVGNTISLFAITRTNSMMWTQDPVKVFDEHIFFTRVFLNLL
jgi:hypothetical protein